MTKQIELKDILQILDYIVDGKSGLFIIGQKLDLLYSWIKGYQIASIGNLDKSKNLEVLDDFTKFVQTKNKDNYKNTFGWFGSIRAIHGGGKDGFDAFCMLYKEFRRIKH